MRHIRCALALLLAILTFIPPAFSGVADPVSVTGPQRVLVVAVRFPGTTPTRDLAQIEQRIEKVENFIRASSYGKAWLEPKLVGWYDMPEPLSTYAVSQYNKEVDSTRVRRLLRDALAAARHDVNLDEYQIVWIVVGVLTRPGQGYGMKCYSANPGMLSHNSIKRLQFHMEEVELPGGDKYSRGAIVTDENPHPGHVAHDLLHAMGGVKGTERVVPCLYDFALQSNPRIELSYENFAIYLGPWDLMSRHWIKPDLPPPPPTSFTRLQLGWIEAEQVVTVNPGETREVTLTPLARGKGIIVVRIPVGKRRYLLLENRQPVGGDAMMPSSGLLVLEVDRERREGSGTVRVANANPTVPHLASAPFVPGKGERHFYENAKIGVAVFPLSIEADGSMRVVVTTPARIKEFVTQ